LVETHKCSWEVKWYAKEEKLKMFYIALENHLPNVSVKVPVKTLSPLDH
jgi:hypothetical protein